MEGLLGNTNAPNMEIKHIPGKGRGVFSNETLLQGRYVAEYKTTVVYEKAKRAEHEEIYAMNEEPCMVLEVQTRKGWMCLDATRKIGTVGRLFNHAPSGRATLQPHKPLFVRGKWRVGFLAARNILPGEELTWDYGCPPEGQPWLMKKAVVVSYNNPCLVIPFINREVGCTNS